MRKTLDALAGGDDKIYVILDDREDVWLEDDGTPSANLLKIPPYYYHEEKLQAPANWSEQRLRACAVAFDLDITLLVFLKLLQRIHSLFFKAQIISDNNLDAKFYIQKIKSAVFTLDKVVSFEQLLPLTTDLTHSYEA